MCLVVVLAHKGLPVECSNQEHIAGESGFWVITGEEPVERVGRNHCCAERSGRARPIPILELNPYVTHLA
jgi:hypothetical protein